MGLYDLNNNHNETKGTIPKLNNKNLRECINGVNTDRHKPR